MPKLLLFPDTTKSFNVFTFSCQILIIFSFVKKFLQTICIRPVKRNLHISSYLGYLKFCNFFAYLKLHGQGFFKNVYIIIFRHFFFANIFLFWILQEKFYFFKFEIFLQILKVEHKSFPMINIFRIWISNKGFRGGCQIAPPPSVSWFSNTQQQG